VGMSTLGPRLDIIDAGLKKTEKQANTMSTGCASVGCSHYNFTGKLIIVNSRQIMAFYLDHSSNTYDRKKESLNATNIIRFVKKMGACFLTEFIFSLLFLTM
jgi:hypothetical protein